LDFADSEPRSDRGQNRADVSRAATGLSERLWLKPARNHSICAVFSFLKMVKCRLFTSEKRSLYEYSQKILDRLPFFAQHASELMDEGWPVSFSPIYFPGELADLLDDEGTLTLIDRLLHLPEFNHITRLLPGQRSV
jgi:hypothetical protein